MQYSELKENLEAYYWFGELPTISNTGGFLNPLCASGTSMVSTRSQSQADQSMAQASQDVGTHLPEEGEVVQQPLRGPAPVLPSIPEEADTQSPIRLSPAPQVWGDIMYQYQNKLPLVMTIGTDMYSCMSQEQPTPQLQFGSVPMVLPQTVVSMPPVIPVRPPMAMAAPSLVPGLPAMAAMTPDQLQAERQRLAAAAGQAAFQQTTALLPGSPRYPPINLQQYLQLQAQKSLVAEAPLTAVY